MSITQASSEYFSCVAGSWDAIRAGYFGTEVRETAIAKAYLSPNAVVADVGGGTGFLTAGLAPLFRQVHVIDGSAAMLEVARKNLSEFDNVEYHLADGASLPFPAQSLDAVFANMYLHHVPDPLAAIQEMVRVLRPGGRLVITDMEAHPYAWLKDEMADAWQGFDLDQVRAWFEQAGLVNVIVDCNGQNCCVQSDSQIQIDEPGHQARINIFAATGTRRMSMRDTVRENYAALAAASSTCGCGAPAATGDSACCGSTSSASSCCGASEAAIEVGDAGARYYSPVELSAAPQEAAEFSLACGNPITLSGLRPGEVALDIGSGGGLDAFLAAQKVGPGGRVIGVDMTPAMLERARASASRYGISNVEFRQGDAESLPVEDASVDVVLSNCVINLTEDKGKVFREAFRALRPGGRLEVSDVVAAGPIPLEEREDREGWAECVTGALPEGEYLDLISQAGFENISIRRSPGLGERSGVSLYSAIVSAQKPGGAPAASCGCGCH